MARAMKHQPPPAFFVRGPSPFARLFFFGALSLILMAVDSRLQYLVEVRQGFMALLNPLQLIASTPADLYRQSREYLTSHSQLLQENRELRQQSLIDGAQLQKLNSLELENGHLRELLGAMPVIKTQSQLTEILHMGRDPFTHKVIINSGTRNGLAAGQAVVDAAGVIGQITRVYPFSSEVTLITNQDLAIPIQVERNGLRAIAFGHGRDNLIDLPYLPANVDVREGDRIITSGLDSVYPAGLAVAMVTHIARNPDSPFALISCTPIAGINNHKQLLVLSMPQAANAEAGLLDKQQPGTESINQLGLPPANADQQP